jgi:hypothetical protein
MCLTNLLRARILKVSVMEWQPIFRLKILSRNKPSTFCPPDIKHFEIKPYCEKTPKWTSNRLQHVFDWWLSLQPPAHSSSSLADFSTLKMEAIRSFKSSVHTRSTWRHVPEDGIFLYELYSSLFWLCFACFCEVEELLKFRRPPQINVAWQ